MPGNHDAGKSRLWGQGRSKNPVSHTGGKTWPPSSYHHVNLLYLAEQKNFADQEGTVKSQDRFTGDGTIFLHKVPARGAHSAGGQLACFPPNGGSPRNAPALLMTQAALAVDQ